MNITYDPPVNLEDPDIGGFFSFSLYTPHSDSDKFDKYFKDPDSLLKQYRESYQKSTTPIKRSLTFIYALTSYLAIVNDPGSEFHTWKVLLHTDTRTRDANPETFAMFMRHGMILGMIGEDTLHMADHSTKESAERDIEIHRGNIKGRASDIFTVVKNLVVEALKALPIFEAAASNVSEYTSLENTSDGVKIAKDTAIRILEYTATVVKYTPILEEGIPKLEYAAVALESASMEQIVVAAKTFHSIAEEVLDVAKKIDEAISPIEYAMRHIAFNYKSIPDEKKAILKDISKQAYTLNQALGKAVRISSDKVLDFGFSVLYLQEDEESIPNRHLVVAESIIRATRYYPLFKTDKPVFVRDADTIFDELITDMLLGRELDIFTMKVAEKAAAMDKNATNNTKKRTLLSSDDIIAKHGQPFPHYLGQWESYCLAKVIDTRTKNATTFFIGIDNYSFDKSAYNKFGTFNNIPEVANVLSEKGHRTRGLAGLVTSLERLPMEALTIFKSYVNNVLNAGLHSKKTYMIDELYLTYVLYRFKKAEGKLGFIFANYVYTYISNICYQIAKEGFQEKDKFLYEIFNEVCSRDGYDGQTFDHLRPYIQMFYLKYPELHIPDQAFYNPLKNIELKQIKPEARNDHKYIPAHPFSNDYKNKNLVFEFPLRQSYRRMKTRRRRNRRVSRKAVRRRT
jgi:hypothetical protein